ncbi:MAG: hypothetical protein WKF96_23360 [Solirubrobacteraceae bacterium]
MKVQRDGRNVTVEVRADGEGVVSHAGSALVALIADKSGLTRGVVGGARGPQAVAFPTTPSQEASNLFFWQVDGWLTLRVKSDPTDLHYEPTQPLFPRGITPADATVCLSWEITPRQTIRDPRFVSVHRVSPWSISLVELLAAGDDSDSTGGVLTPLGPRRPGGPSVTSARPPRVAEDDIDAPSTDE